MEEADHGGDHVGHVPEAAQLAAVAEDREGLVGERLADEAGDDHAVRRALARAPPC